jgi:glycogen(starch) synthase
VRILLVTKAFSRTSGGAENHIYNLVQQLKDTHDFTILTSATHNDLVDGVNIIRLPSTLRVMDYIFSAKLKRVLKSMIDQFDLVHCHNYCCYYVDTAARIAKQHGKPLVITNHGVFPSRNMFTAALMFLYNHTIGIRTWRLADTIISVSDFAKQTIVRMGAPARNNRVIHNGIDLDEFDFISSDVVRHQGIILYVGRIVPEKGLDFLVDALSTMDKGSYRLLVAGDDSTPYGANVRRRVEARGLSRRVLLCGKQERKSLIKMYRSSSVFVLPSSYEPFGIVLLEAMAAGLPVVATRVGGVPEILAGTRNRMVSFGDVDGLARAIKDLAGRKDIGEQNLTYVKRFRTSVMAKETERIYLKFGEAKHR